MSGGDRLAALAAALDGRPGIEPPGGGRGFGSRTLRRDGRILAMVAGDDLVVRLPPERVAALVAAGRGMPHRDARGRPMRAWLRLAADDAGLDLAGEIVAAAPLRAA